jgi:hypothetical protein
MLLLPDDQQDQEAQRKLGKVLREKRKDQTGGGR